MPVLEEQLIISPDISREGEAAILRTYMGLMKSHEGGDAQFSVVESPDPDGDRPEQRLDVIGVRAKRSDVDTVRGLGSSAYALFSQVESVWKSRPDLLNNIYLSLKEGKDIYAVYDHPQIHNIAVGSAALHCVLIDFVSGEYQDSNFGFEEDILISKGVSLLDVMGGFPAIDVLSNVWNSYFSHPPSPKVRNAIDHQTRKDINQKVVEIFEARGTIEKTDETTADEQPVGRIRTLAASGHTDSKKHEGTIPRRHSVVHMGPMAHGTTELMMKPNSYTLLVGLDLDNKAPRMVIDRLLPPIKKREEAHGRLGRLARLLSERNGEEHRYHPTRESFDAATH